MSRLAVAGAERTNGREIRRRPPPSFLISAQHVVALRLRGTLSGAQHTSYLSPQTSNLRCRFQSVFEHNWAIRSSQKISRKVAVEPFEKSKILLSERLAPALATLCHDA